MRSKSTSVRDAGMEGRADSGLDAEMQVRHEIRDDQIWMMCDEGSPHFVWAAK